MPISIKPAPGGIADAVEGAVTQIIEVDCDITAVVGDYVRINTVTPNLVDVAVNNLLPAPVIGVILTKPTTTTAEVAVSGILDDADSTSPGKLFLSATGRITNTSPASGYQQKMGYSFGNGKYDFKPEKTLVNIT